MASVLKVDSITGVTTAGSISVTGEGNSTTTNLQQGLAKAWCFFDGTAGTISFSDSFNGSSLSDVATGQYDMNFSSSMSNNTYPALFSGADRNDNHATSPQSSSSCRMLNRMGIDGQTASDNDDSKCQFSLHGDLA
jgi:hypothetical protein